MSILPRLSFRSITILLAVLLTASFAFTSESAFAGRRGESRHDSRRIRAEQHRADRLRYGGHRSERHRSDSYRSSYRYGPSRYSRVIVTSPRYYPGKFVGELPSSYSTLTVGGWPYYYEGGAYYYRYPEGYVVVGPPIGTVVRSLPFGYGTVWVGGLYYYYYGNVFYRQVPLGYEVVWPPATSTVVLKEPAVERPAQAASGRVSVIAARLNVRTGPSLSNPILYQVKETTTLKVHGRDKAWLYVELPSGKYGWVMQKFTVAMDLPPSG